MIRDRWVVVDEIGSVWSWCDSEAEAERRRAEHNEEVGDNRYRLRVERVQVSS